MGYEGFRSDIWIVTILTGLLLNETALAETSPGTSEDEGQV